MFAWLILVLVLGSLFYSAYSKLKPDSLISLFNTQIQRSYPGSKLRIAKIDYMLSIDFKLSLKGLTLMKGDKTIAGANEVQLKVPWWLILFNRGNASINISDLNIYVSSIPLDYSNSSAEISRPVKSTKVEIILPEYLVDAHYTVRAKNISIKELDGDRRYFTLTKLLVREFQYGKNSAFELNIPINITHKNKRYSSDLWLFGDVTPDPKAWVINYRGEFKTKETAEGSQYEDLVIDGKSILNPSNVDLTSSIHLLVEKKKIGTGEITAKYDHIQLNLKFTQFPMNYLKMAGEEITNPFWSKIEGVGEGEVKFSKFFAKDDSSTLSAKLHFPGMFSLSSDQKIPGQWFLDFKNEIIQSSFISPKQDLKFSRRAVLDFDKSQVVQYSQEIGFTDCDLKTALLSVQSLSGLIDPIPQPYHSTVVLLKHCLSGEKIFDGSFRFGIFPHQKYYLGELQNDQSKLVVKYSAKAQIQEFQLDLHNFSWNSSYSFLAPYMMAGEGVFDGKMEGKWNSHWSDGTWLVNIKGDNLKDASGEFMDLNQKLWDYFSLDSSSVPKKKWSASVKNKNIKLNSFVLESSDPAHLSGNLTSILKVKSYLSINFPKNRKWKPVKKEVTEVFWKKEAP
jgi:hypothetical protein